MVPARNGGLGDDLLLVGRIIKAQGIRGEVKMHSFSRSPDSFAQYATVFVRCQERGDCQRMTIESCRSKGESVILALTGIASRNEAETLVGCELLIDRSEMPELNPGEYYWEDLLGRSVVTSDGHPLGTVTELFATGAHDVLVVGDGQKEYLIPVTGEYVSFAEDLQRTVVVNPVAGLLDMNEESVD